MTAATEIAFAPLLPWSLIGALALLAALVVSFAAWRRASGLGWRTLAFVVGLLALANPALVEEERQPINDVVALVVDDSPSQRIGERRAEAEKATAEIRARLGKLEGIEVRAVTAGQIDSPGAEGDGTRLFGTLARIVSDVPRSRLAGAILITDGQVHDVPADLAQLGFDAPLHALLTGSEKEGDRRLKIEEAPSYGIVGNELSLSLRVDDLADPRPGRTARLTIARDAEPPRTIAVPVGQTTRVPFTLSHGGTTVLDIQVEAGPQELTLLNNRSLVVVNGVRDRLRVLLVSGEPHAGERTWRNLLKADPSVDLVHFTILRPPEKQDMTPVRELSLIAFPTRELFEQKLSEFHLIIFDRYRRRGLLPQAYVDNVVDYVRKGGAVLEAAGPAFAGPLSLYRTALGDVLPGRPTGHVFTEGFKAKLSEVGMRHPVTGDLPGGNAGLEPPSWGRWFRQIDVDALRGQSVLEGAGNKPVLVLDRVGEGRIAQLLSDQAWLWARGYEGGGPQAELLRRLAHWLMKEPELEEEDLRAFAQGRRLDILRRSLTPGTPPVTVTSPSGETQRVELVGQGAGRAVGSLAVDEPGLYKLTDGTRTAVAAVGTLNPLEYADMRATPDLLRPIAETTGGAVRWLKSGIPEIRKVRPNRDAQGRGWIGLRANGDYVVTGVKQLPLLPATVVLLLLLGGLVAAWRREGR